MVPYTLIFMKKYLSVQSIRYSEIGILFFPFVLVSDVFLPRYPRMMSIGLIILFIYETVETSALSITPSDTERHRPLGSMVMLPLDYVTRLC